MIIKKLIKLTGLFLIPFYCLASDSNNINGKELGDKIILESCLTSFKINENNFKALSHIKGSTLAKKLSNRLFEKALSSIKKGNEIYSNLIMVQECSGEPVFEKCYSNEVGQSDHSLYLYSSSLSALNLKENLSIKEVKAIFGKPYQETDNLLIFISEPPTNIDERDYYDHKYELEIKFVDGKLKTVIITTMLEDC